MRLKEFEMLSRLHFELSAFGVDSIWSCLHSELSGA